MRRSWKLFYRWLQLEILENAGLQVKLNSEQRVNYPRISEKALNRFVDSLEATLDNNSSFYLFPPYEDNKSFEELFDFLKIFCGIKSESKRIGEASYGDLKKLFNDWKKANQEETSWEKPTLNSRVIPATDDNTRVILLIGKTGSGKSALGNVLVNEKAFRESDGSVSETRRVQTKNFELELEKNQNKKIHYLVIDTVGFGDTKLDNKQVLESLTAITEAIGDNGLNQIFWVSDGRFTWSNIEAYQLLEKVIFDQEAFNHTTIIRTKFPEFEDHQKCQVDQEKLLKENSEIWSILKSVRGVIYLDNPPVEYGKMAKRVREKSQTRLITLLGACQNIYYPANLTEIKQRIDNYQTKSEQLEKELKEKEEKIKEQEQKFQENIQAMHTKQQIDGEINRRQFQQKLENTRIGYERRLKYDQEQLVKDYQSKIQVSQQRYEREQAQAESQQLAEVERIKANYQNRRVRVGEPACSQGHRKVSAYNEKGNHPDPDDFEDGISYVYCPTCQKNDHNFELLNAKTYSFEEWCKEKNQNYASQLEEMNRQIKEQEKRKQDIIVRIKQEKSQREALFQKESTEQKKLQREIIEKQKRVEEERLRQRKLAREGKLISDSQIEEKRLKRELEQKKQELENRIKESQIQRVKAQEDLQAFIQQRLHF